MDKKDKIRILHIAQPAGGVDKYVQMLVKYLDKEKFENIIVCSQNYKKVDYVGLVSSYEQIDMYRAIGKTDFKAVVAVRSLIKKYKPDIVYAHSSKAGAISRIANIGLNTTCIYNPHGWAFNMQCSKKKQKVYSFIEKIVEPFCNKIVCISEAEKQSAIDNKICSVGKLQVIYNGVDIDAYESRQHNLKTKSDLGISEQSFVVGMVGRISQQKAPDTFIRMAKKIIQLIPNAQFIIVGSGEMQKDIEAYASMQGLGDVIHITGWVDNPLCYVELFDVAVLLSRWEGFGLAIPEYMMCKKPVVATAVDAIPNIVTDRVNGLLVPVDDPDAACNAVLELYNDSNLRRRLTAQGTKDVYERFDARRVSEEHQKLFEQILPAHALSHKQKLHKGKVFRYGKDKSYTFSS